MSKQGFYTHTLPYRHVVELSWRDTFTVQCHDGPLVKGNHVPGFLGGKLVNEE